MKFSDKLKKNRKLKHITQTELAQMLGVGQTTIINWENDHSLPKKREYYEKLAEIFNVDIHEFTNENEAITNINDKWTNKILDLITDIFKGDELSEEEKTKFFEKIKEIYVKNAEK